jgi:sugar O-acyltransferase (sialic acid O-acetyltransferase NeuD family)
MPQSSTLILIGGGGHCKSVIGIAEKCGFDILGIIDRPAEFGNKVLDYKIVGNDDDIVKYVGKAVFHITVGFVKNADLRIKLWENVVKHNGKIVSIVSPNACISKYSEISEGSAVMNFANINAGARIGRNAIINNFANIEHDVKIGEHTHISTGAMINGDCKIGSRCFVGSQAVIANGINICDDAIIGAGAVVVKDITQKGIYVGNPATKIQ